jgi:deoxyadenosine/deoxycytidine kinase
VILCFEGAPAVGKSTTARDLESNYGYVRIPEVNELFGKDTRTEKYWYFERQAERWAMAKEQAAKGKFVILDGDVFQPIWFNAFYPDGPWDHYLDVSAYFNGLIDDERMGIPDKYVYFQLNEESRSTREIERSMARGKTLDAAKQKVEYFKPLAKKQLTYFRGLAEIQPSLIQFIECGASTKVSEVILNLDIEPRDITLNGQDYLEDILINLKSF